MTRLALVFLIAASCFAAAPVTAVASEEATLTVNLSGATIEALASAIASKTAPPDPLPVTMSGVATMTIESTIPVGVASVGSWDASALSFLLVAALAGMGFAVGRAARL